MKNWDCGAGIVLSAKYAAVLAARLQLNVSQACHRVGHSILDESHVLELHLLTFSSKGVLVRCHLGNIYIGSNSWLCRIAGPSCSNLDVRCIWISPYLAQYTVAEYRRNYGAMLVVRMASKRRSRRPMVVAFFWGSPFVDEGALIKNHSDGECRSVHGVHRPK
jgi:hypothetical protein